ncbi:magnesium transporter CorA family protein [Afifella marina]|uniref:Magnesium transport protein CorA n=1 Tax=Afifella marina DSM 2698 TaxID=1120955 RepID=A0A1G5MK29_AFIMA|nr:magnesium transporter CorA family protein [Afifella marina]MBK1623765.1 magnesium transporter [Afifella marina DSM 2698]MBK1627319.1 magnesium transporter [Afifella marina]MBK5918652.1 magnesium transporter [Afifella marina]RAI22726.1 magnesium transporter [Afifella marina DSM 2698]SCZ24928.1 magnesium transporter [Afifella marina DSM 2698]
MLQIYKTQGDRLVPVDGADLTSPPSVDTARAPLWIDLLEPTAAEAATVENYIGIDIPAVADLEEIEPSSRLYAEEGAVFMTVTTVVGVQSGEPAKTPVAFILRNGHLVTVRYAEPRQFRTFLAQAQKGTGERYDTAEAIMLGLLEAQVNWLADLLELIGHDIDSMSQGVFQSKVKKVSRKTADLRSTMGEIGRQGDLLSLVRESLVSLSRLLTYHHTLSPRAKGDKAEKADKEARNRTRILVRDAQSLSEHASFLSTKLSFMLDATLGLINLEQNQIIKIFSVVAVIFVPPTLVASIYGMNFEGMPELGWSFGYPFALILMLISAGLPLLYFKRRGWL